MGTRDPRIDAYIEKSAAFAKPVLAHLRGVVHEGCPAVEETMKWSKPHFMYEGLLCGMAAFKEHCAFGFWKRSLIVGPGKVNSKDAMGQFGCIRSVAELPSKQVLAGYVKQAMKLNENGVTVARKTRVKVAKPVVVPPELRAALARDRKAAAAFEAFSPSHRREYVQWIAEAKREDTRQRRLATTIEWLAQGKALNWKYERRNA